MTKVLVTGGAGFIGSHLVQALVERGDEVVVLDNLRRGNKLDRETMRKVKLVKADVRDPDIVMRCTEGCTRIYHLAAVLGVDIVADNPLETMETEVIGTRNVVEAAVFHGVEKIVYTSTSGVYGHTAIERSVTEDIIVDPRTSYSIAKRYNEIYLTAAWEEKGVSAISLRYFNVYGPRQDTRMVIPRFLAQALRGEPITVYGDGRQTRDFTYVADVVRATVLVADLVGGTQILNVANENEVTIMTLAERIKGLTGASSEIVFLEPPRKRYDFEVERRVGCCDKLFGLVKYKPSTPLDEGLQAVLQEAGVATRTGP